MSTLSITARQFKALVSPVLPHASRDRMMPVLNTVRIETRGRWLLAIATDRFRVGLNRQERPEGAPDDWSATIPLAAVKGIISTFAPLRGLDADLSLTIDGGNLAATAEGALIGGFFDASFKWPLETGEFPKVGSLVIRALQDAEGGATTKLRMEYVAAFRHADVHGSGLWMRHTTSDPDRGPVLVTDGENFVGMVVPRRGGSEFPDLSGWVETLGGDSSQTEPTATEPEKAAS